MKAGSRAGYGAHAPSGIQPPRAPGELRRGAETGADRIAALSALVEELSGQIDAIEGASRREAIRRGVRQAATQPEPVRRAPEPRPAAEPAHPAGEPPSDRLGLIEGKLAAIAEQLARREAPVEPAPAPIPQPHPTADRSRREEIGSLQAAIAEISARQHTIDLAGGRQLGAVDTIALEDAIAALRSDIASIDRRIADEVRRGEAFGRSIRSELAERTQPAGEAFGERAFAMLRAELAEIRQGIELAARETTLASIESGYGHVIERLDDIVRRVPERERIEAIGRDIARLAATIEQARPREIEGELEDIRNAIASIGAARDDGTERQIAELRAVVERMAETRPAPDLSRIERDIAALRLAFDQRMTPTTSLDPGALSRLEERLDALAGRFDAITDLPGLTGPSAGEAMAALRSEISDLRQDVSSRQPPRLDEIEQQMRALVDRLDMTAGRDDGPALAQLEAQVGALAEKLAFAEPSADALSKVEANLDRLQGLLGEARRDTIEAARVTARTTVEEFAGQLAMGRDDELVRALREDLRRLQDAARHSDQQNQNTLEAVHDTLAKVVDRIAQLEAEEEAGPFPGYASLKERARNSLAPRPPFADDRPEDHRPLAPGSGRPEIGPPQPRPDMEAGARPADRKADFIAAARRAAQAAQAETAKARIEESEAVPEERPGPLARIGQALRSRRRPLVLAIAAVVLALGAAKFGPSLQDRITAALTPPVAERASDLDPTATGSVAPRPARQATPALKPPAAAAEAPALVAPKANNEAIAFSSDPFASYPGPALEAAVAPPPPAPPALDFARVEAAAATGDAVAAFLLAKHYAEPEAGKPDIRLAAQWYERASKAGLALAQYRLGSLYERGEGVSLDVATAERWYEKASRQGNAGATHNLAVLISEGATGKPDYAKAAALFTVAAEQGVADSQYNLGVLYARGLGVPADLVQSYKWFALAALKGDRDAGQRRDEVAKALKADDLARARAAVQAFAPTPMASEANAEPAPKPQWVALPAATSMSSRKAAGSPAG